MEYVRLPFKHDATKQMVSKFVKRELVIPVTKLYEISNSRANHKNSLNQYEREGTQS